MPANRLIFVYNADSGLFNTLADIAHKVASPQTYACTLCALTHGHFSMRKAWRRFVENSHVNMRFYHRDEFTQRYPEISEPLPAIFLETASGIRPFISKAQLEPLDNVQQFIELMDQAMGKIRH